MNITSWELYWILKLDDIRTAFFAISLISLILVLFVSVAWFVVATGLFPNKEVVNTLRRAISVLTTSMIISAVVAIFIPTTAQMAAIKVVPMITNTAFVQKELSAEAAELYGLLKQYLKANINNNEVEK